MYKTYVEESNYSLHKENYTLDVFPLLK